MNFQKIFRLIASLLFTAAALITCKPAPQQKETISTLSNANSSSCACNDMDCWRKATNDGVNAQLSCVQSSLGAAANVASAGGYASAQMLAAAADLYQLLYSTMKVVQKPERTVSYLDLFKAIAQGNSDVLKYAFGADYTKSPGLNCLKNGADILKLILDISSNLISLIGAEDPIKAMVSVIKSLGSEADLLVNGLTVLDNCAAVFAGPSDEVGQTLKSVTNAWKKAMAAFKTLVAFVECGWGFYKGGKVLIGNSVCLWDDLKGWRASSESLESLRQKTLNQPAPNTTNQNLCNDEPTSCNLFAMQKFGLWLHTQTYWSYATRSYLCADMCGNRGAGSAECTKNAAAVFQGDAGKCTQVCNTSQCQNAIDYCVSYCCGQDGSCTDAAHSKMVQYNKN